MIPERQEVPNLSNSELNGALQGVDIYRNTGVGLIVIGIGTIVNAYALKDVSSMAIGAAWTALGLYALKKYLDLGRLVTAESENRGLTVIKGLLVRHLDLNEAA